MERETLLQAKMKFKEIYGEERQENPKTINKLKKDLGEATSKIGKLNNRINDLQFQLERANFNLETYKEVFR